MSLPEFPVHPEAYVVDAGHVHETLGQRILLRGMDLVLDFDRSHGVWIWDARRDRRLFNFFSFYAALPLSFNHPKMLEPAFLDRLTRSALHKPSNCDTYTGEYAKFIETFGRVAMRDLFRYMFVIEGGAQAAENALKAAFDWKVRKNLAKGLGEKGHQIIHFKQAFHGRTGYTMSMTDSPDPRKTQYYPLFKWPRVTNPKLSFPVTPAVLADVQRAEAQSLAEIERAFVENPDDIAGIIIEPIQGEGGDNHFRPEFLQSLRRVADEREALLIFDEVQCGMGATGTIWCWEQLGVRPDIMTFGKKAQVCGILAGPRLDEVPLNVFKVPSRISSTWEGNLTDMVRATRILEIIEEDQLLDNVKKTGAFLLAELQRWAEETGAISNVRGRGFIIAFDCADTAARDALWKRAYDSGVLILKCGEKSIRLRPTLDLNEADAATGLALLKQVLVA
jgi:L-lysine 6-transaminase